MANDIITTYFKFYGQRCQWSTWNIMQGRNRIGGYFRDGGNVWGYALKMETDRYQIGPSPDYLFVSRRKLGLYFETQISYSVIIPMWVWCPRVAYSESKQVLKKISSVKIHVQYNLSVLHRQYDCARFLCRHSIQRHVRRTDNTGRQGSATMIG
jgi:hypothetical protein